MNRERTGLVCLPFAGVGASFFHPWSALAGDDLVLVPVELPGRERRIDQDPHRDVHAAVAAALPEVLDAVGDLRRVVLFGHSLGAVLAYELAHRLAAVPEVTVAGLIASGSPDPHNPRPDRATGLSDEEFVARVRRFAGFSEEALDDPEMRELILPTLRADVQMHESYVPSTDEPLPAPITAVRGRDDALVGTEDAAGWAKVTSRDFDLVEVPGGHMYLVDSAELVLRLADPGR